MKKMLFLLLLAPGLLIAQDNKPIGNFNIEHAAVVYRHVFTDSLDSADVIVKKLIAFVPFNSCIKNAGGYIISGRIDLATYTSTSLLNTILVEEKGGFTIEVKNGRYRLTIRNLFLVSQNPAIAVSSFEYCFFSATHRDMWSSEAHDQLGNFDKRLINMFTLDLNQSSNNW